MRILIVRKPDGSIEEYPLSAGQLSIGRDPESDIALNDSQVSWQHASIECTQDQCVVEDQSSTNGTFVNEKRVDEQLLVTGDIIKLGPYQISFESDAKPLSAASSSERTLFAVAQQHPHRIDDAKDPYATVIPQPNRRIHKNGATGKTAHSINYGPFPSPAWLRDYPSKLVKSDAIAGVTVAALTIPQGMAYALLAGLPPVMGLYASMLPMIVYAFIGTGKQSSVAPVALDSILVAIGLGVLAQGGTEAYIALAVALAAMIGMIQVVMGVMRLGF